MKKMFVLKMLGVIACSAIISHHTLAADAGKFYLGADLGASEFSGDGAAKDAAFTPGQSFKDSDTSYGLHAGYQFNDWFAAELGYTDFGEAVDHFKIRPDIVFIVAPNDTQTIAAKGVTLSSVFSHSFNRHFALFGTLGVSSVNYKSRLFGGFSEVAGDTQESVSFSDHGLMYGVGVRYKLSDSFGLRTDLRRNHIGDFDLDSASFGLEYSF